MTKKQETKSRRRRAPLSVVERDFYAAIDRLVSGKPSIPRLRRLAVEGRLSINPTTVALEARRSRTLIALEDCRLPSVRNRIFEVSRKDDIATPRTAAEVITRLREQVSQLKQELSAALEGQAQHFLARERAEREAAKWRDAFRREENQAQEDSKVSPIRPTRPKH